MAELAMCRVCLAEDVQLRLIANTHLQEMYESLTLMPLETNDSRPIGACYICFAGLQNCYRLRKRCLRSEELLTHVVTSDVLQPLNVQEDCTQRLSVEHPVILLSIGNELQNNTNDDAAEDSARRTDAPDVFDHDTVQQQDNEDIIKMEPQEDHDAQIEDYIQCSHVADVVDVTESDPDDIQTDAEDIKFEIEGVTIEELELNDDNQSSLPACNVRPKIVKVVLERMVLNNTNPQAGVLALKNLGETESLLVTDQKNQNIVGDKRITEITVKKIDATLRKRRDNKVSALDEAHEQTPKILKSYLASHTRTRIKKKRYQCHVCKKYFGNNGSLTRHKNTHSNNKPYLCQICKKSFSRKILLADHLSIHSGEKRFQCNNCHKCFHSKSNLQQHMYSHASQKRFKCEVCHKCFTLKFHLKRHLYTHAGETRHRYQCHVCKTCLSSEQDLTKHMSSHTGQSDIFKSKRCIREKRYKCDICNKMLTTRYHLREHIYTHTGVKRFQCDICNKRFSTKCNIREHIFNSHFEVKINTTTKNSISVISAQIHE